MLTEKEINVLELKKEGFSQLEIAKKLGISQPAVSNFYNNALWKIEDAKQTLRLKEELDTQKSKKEVKNKR